MKKYLYIALTILLVFQVGSLPIFADEESKGPISISYEDAVQMMIKNNRELDSIAKQIEIQKEIIIEVKNESSRLDGFIYDDENKINDRATAVYVDPVIAQNKLNSLKRSYEDKIFELEQSVIDYYVNLVTKENQITVYENLKVIDQKEFEQKSLELQLGKITENDVLPYEIEIDTVNKDLENAIRNKNLTLMDFNYLITNELVVKYIPNTTNINSILTGNYLALETLDLNTIIKKNVENDATLASYREDIEKYEQQKKVERVYTSSVSAYKNFDSNIEENTLDTDKRKKTIQYKVYTDFDNLQSLLLDYKIAQNSLTLAENSQKTANVKFELGLVTQIDVSKAEKNLISAKNDVTNALNAYYKAYQAFLRFH
ncbi:TolC family protein [Fusibacter sp. 3D3]|uniref:TolC family protein n=1 Tax=Fusibacter sp. 3D3 TaxID=1048380 RepID=UPI00085335A6|nr:TolC family protein [Fusibacter sp. 3D3]GAU77752.1 hypothetical protein F3D3_2381 [Fusibacter sp. 3D3]